MSPSDHCRDGWSSSLHLAGLVGLTHESGRMRHFTGGMFLGTRNPVTTHLFISSFDIHHREGFYMKKIFQECLSGKFMILFMRSTFCRAVAKFLLFTSLSESTTHCLSRSQIPYLNHGDNNCTYITGSKYCEVCRKWRMWRMWDNGN